MAILDENVGIYQFFLQLNKLQAMATPPLNNYNNIIQSIL